MPDEERIHRRHRTRLRAAAFPYPDDLSTEKLLELMLYELVPQCDTAGAARTLLQGAGGIGELLLTRPAPAQAAPTQLYLQALGAAGRCYIRQSTDCACGFSCLVAARRWFTDMLRKEPAEEAAVLTLDAGLSRLRLVHEPFGENGVEALLERIALGAITESCAYLFAAFNHPAGFLAPSREELLAVTGLIRLCRLYGVVPADVLLLSKDGARGLSETEHFPPGTFSDFNKGAELKK